ncbi:hypothetical protein VNO77_39162 [Canavalia gladiata]|uniref:Uncharacterized protein n=1 Tax=Canavalia gladiata TaxID=3824 RepID=A0AAN9PVK7_CANGL
MGKVKGILAIRTCEGFRDSTKDIWGARIRIWGLLVLRTCPSPDLLFSKSRTCILIYSQSNIGMIAKTRIGNLVQFQLVFIFPALSYDIMTIVTHPCGPQVEVGSLQDQVTCWFTGLANQGIAAMVLMQISKPRDYNRGANADQGTGRLTGLANQEITAMVLMQIRGWLAYWISKPRNYSNGANTDQVADWLTGLANQEITAMVLMQTRWLVGLLD